MVPNTTAAVVPGVNTILPDVTALTAAAGWMVGLASTAVAVAVGAKRLVAVGTTGTAVAVFACTGVFAGGCVAAGPVGRVATGVASTISVVGVEMVRSGVGAAVGFAPQLASSRLKMTNARMIK